MIQDNRPARRQHLGADDHQASSTAPRCNDQAGDFARYESLKSALTAKATTPAEYEAACRRAAQIAGV